MCEGAKDCSIDPRVLTESMPLFEAPRAREKNALFMLRIQLETKSEITESQL